MAVTEADWMACYDPRSMVPFLEELASRRKLRLCLAAIRGRPLDPADERITGSTAIEYIALSCEAHGIKLGGDLSSSRPMSELMLLCQLLRDIFGNPFRPAPTLDPAWLRWHDDTIPRLAQQMYDSRDFSAMPILADSLEEAGCTSADILEHCRGPGPHARGCWLVDSILVKE